MKHLPLLALAACLMAATAQAQSPASTPEPAPAPTAAPLVETAAPASTPTKAEDKPRLSEANCVRQTGSRIRQRDAKTVCNGQPGRSYSKDELDRTGHTDLADALRTLDPAVR
ncbi:MULTISPECIES: hypothetical protein [unclassified Pseudoxanthomonas]|uniref:hypothetical protein n=1 Tax=unclassified Pseudoxanthomonas TaxID=2645906 RepID=UPI0008E5A212|nr:MULTISPECIES: hypothetical protein [unclassified Pseudoxanthomonas]PPJ42075.1 hypothetical protein C0063_01850 [Pseudoxanthomonas sp. KAs_5_3]SFV28648.1 hypothetical protein SAMN05428990_1064 [Pseudoxanthomonas sp. YR558]